MENKEFLEEMESCMVNDYDFMDTIYNISCKLDNAQLRDIIEELYYSMYLKIGTDKAHEILRDTYKSLKGLYEEDF